MGPKLGPLVGSKLGPRLGPTLGPTLGPRFGAPLVGPELGPTGLLRERAAGKIVSYRLFAEGLKMAQDSHCNGLSAWSR